MSPIFCLLNLWRQPRNKESMKTKMQAFITPDNVRRLGPRSNAKERSYVWFFINVMILVLETEGTYSAIGGRAEDLKRWLRKFGDLFPGDVRVRGVVLHHCDGCCASVEDMLSRLKSILQYLFIDWSMPKPSFKSWTHSVFCICMTVLFLFHDLLLFVGPHVAHTETVVEETGDGDNWHGEQMERRKTVSSYFGRASAKRDLIMCLCWIAPQLVLFKDLHMCESDSHLLAKFSFFPSAEFLARRFHSSRFPRKGSGA